MRALVTGGTGFVGQWLREHLEAKGDEVWLTDIEIDVGDQGAMDKVLSQSKPDAIYHLAARTHVGDSWDDPAEVLRVNVLGTAVLLAAARKLSSSPQILIVSSAEVYGVVNKGDMPLDESQPLAPASPYAASKAGAEAVALQAWRGFGQHVIVARPFNHIGPRQLPNFVVPALAQRVIDAKASGLDHIGVGNLAAKRDFTDVRDVVVAYRLMIEKAPPGSIFNVCRGEAVSITQIAELLADLAEVNLRFEIDPDLVRPLDVPELTGNGSRLKTLTGWEPQVSLEDTLKDVIAATVPATR